MSDTCGINLAEVRVLPFTNPICKSIGCTLPRTAALLLSCVLFLQSHAPADELAKKSDHARGQAFVLAPQMAAIAIPKTPPLSSHVPDADVVGKNALALEPAQPYRWIASPGEAFSVTARGDGTDRAVLTVWDWENRAVAQAAFVMPFVAWQRD